MSPFYILLAFCILDIAIVTCTPIQRRSVNCGDTNTKLNAANTVKMVCQSLWYLEGTIAHCSPGSPCNQTAMEGIKSSILNNLCQWVR